MFISSGVARIKRHAPRCDLQAASCHRARSRLNSACATRFGNAILPRRAGIPIARRGRQMCRSVGPTFGRGEEAEGRTRPASRFRHLRSAPHSPSSSLLRPTPLHPSPSAKCKTRVESSERSCEECSTLATLKWDESEGGAPLMAGNNRMISPPTLERIS